MTPKSLKTLITQAIKYPLEMRIAAKAKLDGMTEESLCAAMTNLSNLPQPHVVAVYNCLRDLDRDALLLTPELQKLAERL